MVITSTKPLTLTKFLNLPETKPASEFINGKIIQKPMPREDIAACNINFAQQLIKLPNLPKLPVLFPNYAVALAERLLSLISLSSDGREFPRPLLDELLTASRFIPIGQLKSYPPTKAKPKC
jgi:hypothetical protein